MFVKSCLAVAAVLLAMGQPSFAQQTPPIAKGPTGDDMLTYYPKKAMELGREGQAVIECTLTPELTMTACKALSEDPPGYEFGAAAVKLSRLFRMKSGEAGSLVRLPINFRLAMPAQLNIRDWLAHLQLVAAPTTEDLERARPPMLVGEGTVTVRCHVKTAQNLPESERGSVYGCTAAKETPARLGLASAALGLAPLMKFDASKLVKGDPRWTVDLDMSWVAKPVG